MNIELDRKLPFSLEAEQAVLGSVLIEPASMDVLASVITQNDFYLAQHQKIYATMQNMYLKTRNIDAVTLLDALVQDGVYDAAGGKDYLMLIAEVVPTAANVRDYAKIVKDKSTLRALIGVCEKVEEAAYTEEREAEKLVELASAEIFDLAKSRDNKNFIHIRDALLQAYTHLQALATNKDELQGMKTGFPDLDHMLVGMSKADFVLVGARPGMGKTAFALNVAANAAKRSKKAVCIFSLEMSVQQLVERLLSSEAMVDSYHMRDGNLSQEEWDKISDASAELSDCNILMDETSAITVSGIRSKLRMVKDLGLIVIDYLGLMPADSDKYKGNRAQEVAEISRNLKLLAKEFEVPVLCCAQLNRGPEGRTDKRPSLSELRDSGAIEQDADMVMFLYREDYYKRGDAPVPQNEAEIIVAKNRHGSVGTVKVGWMGAYTKFVTPPKESDIAGMNV